MNQVASPGVNPYHSCLETPATVRSLILELFAQQGQTPEEAERNYRWFFQAHAFSQLKLRVLRHREGDGERAVGVVAMIARHWQCAGAPAELALLGNLVVDAQHRSLGPAIQLMRDTLQMVSTAVDFCYLLPNRKAEPLFKRLGAARLGELVRYAKPFHTRSLLQHHAKARRVAFLAPLLDRLLALEEQLPRLLDPRLRLVVDVETDARFDALWQQCEKHNWLVGERSAAYLRWRCTGYPKHQIRLAAATDRQGHLFGYVAFSQADDGSLHIDDLLCRDGLAGIKPLLRLFLGWARKQRVRSVGFSFFGDERVVAILRSLLLLPREGRPVYAAPGHWPLAQGQGQCWYLTQLDEDQ